MKKKSKQLNIILIITYIMLLGFLLINIKEVLKVLNTVIDVFTPFIYGFVLAYILSFPYNFFYNRCFSKIGSKKPKLKGLRKTLALICSYILGFGIIGFLIGVLVPQLAENVMNLVEQIPNYAAGLQNVLNSVVTFVHDNFGLNLYDESTYSQIVDFLMGTDLQDTLTEFVSKIFPSFINFAEVFTTGIYNWLIGIIVSIYMLSNKEKLCYQARAVTVAYLPLKWSRKVLRFTDLCNKKCGKFIIGKIIDSLIIGVICFIGLSIFKFDYALLISVIVGVTNVIPFFGPFLGAIPCALLLLFIDPLQCFWFIIFVIVLQQFDGNVLGPKILGETVGISGFWILFSVLIGGGLFGLPGMLLGVPVFAVIYTLIDEGVTKRLQAKRSLLKKAVVLEEATDDTEIQDSDSNNGK